jgi:hypothetical protein
MAEDVFALEPLPHHDQVFLPLLCPLHHRPPAHSAAPHPHHRARRAEEESKPWLDLLAGLVHSALEDLKWLPAEQEEERTGCQQGLYRVLELGAALGKVLDAVVEVIRGMGSCIGSLVSCHVRSNFSRETLKWPCDRCDLISSVRRVCHSAR